MGKKKEGSTENLIKESQIRFGKEKIDNLLDKVSQSGIYQEIMAIERSVYSNDPVIITKVHKDINYYPIIIRLYNIHTYDESYADVKYREVKRGKTSKLEKQLFIENIQVTGLKGRGYGDLIFKHIRSIAKELDLDSITGIIPSEYTNTEEEANKLFRFYEGNKMIITNNQLYLNIKNDKYPKDLNNEGYYISEKDKNRIKNNVQPSLSEKQNKLNRLRQAFKNKLER